MASSPVALDKLAAAVAVCGKPWPSGKHAHAQVEATVGGKKTTFFRLYSILPDDAGGVAAGEAGAWFAYLRMPVGGLAAQQLGVAMSQASAHLKDSPHPGYDFLAEGEVQSVWRAICPTHF